jgi:uridine kinase
MAVLIGIGGGSGSGKTTVARALAARLGADALVLAEDHYYRCCSTIPDFDPRRYNFDAPAAKDFARLTDDLVRLKAGLNALRPDYDFTSHRRRAGDIALPSARSVIVEGIHALSDSGVRRLIDCAVFLDAGDETRFSRRLARDVAERGRTAQSVHEQWRANVRPMHELHTAPQAGLADLVLSSAGASGPADLAEAIIAHLRSRGLA